MLAPLPPPDWNTHDSLGARLDVRLGNGRLVTYPLHESEFLVGGAAGCDLRLSGENLPPVVCQFTRAADGIRLRKLTPQIDVRINNTLLTNSTPTLLHHGDRITAGPAELVVQLDEPQYHQPKLRLVDPPPPTIPAQPTRTELDDLRALLEEERRELDEDRAIWYRRRQEMEAELAQLPNLDELQRRELAVSARERELASETERRLAALDAEIRRRHAEADQQIAARLQQVDGSHLERIRTLEDEIAQRRSLFEQDLRTYEPQLQQLREVRERLAVASAEIETQRQNLERERAEVVHEREQLDAERQWQHERLKDLDQTLLDRDAELARREEQLANERARLDAERAEYKDDLARLHRWEASLETSSAQIDGRNANINERHSFLQQNASEWEETLRLAENEERRLKEEAARLEQLRTELDQQSAKLAERASQQESQQAALAVLRANLNRQQDAIQQEAATLAAERLQYEQYRRDFETKLREAEQVRAELGALRTDQESEVRVVAERSSLLNATLEEFERKKQELAAAHESLAARERELDDRTAEFAEKAALLKSRIQQVMELQQRLEADRASLAARESSLTETDSDRLAFQEQLRKRNEELSAKAKQLEELSAKLAEDRVVFDRLREGLDHEKQRDAERLQIERQDLATKLADLQRQHEQLAEREATLARQVTRLKQVGETVAAERKAMFEARNAWESDRLSMLRNDESSKHELDTYRARVASAFTALQQQAPDLDQRAHDSLNRLSQAREVLRGQLAELHAYAKQTRDELEQVRRQLQHDTEQLREREQKLDAARSEHRVAVTGFRQQLLDWQSRVGELRNHFMSSESKLDQRQLELDVLARQIDETRQSLEKQSNELQSERRVVKEKRAEMDRHLGDMREWYRRKLRELAAGRKIDESDMPTITGESPPTDAVPLLSEAAATQPPSEPDPGDKQLGELLKSRGLVDENTLQALWTEARRQRRSLRQTLLASGAVTLYQLALIEAGNLDGLVLGRLRVVDRIRSTSKETVYRVYDPQRPGGASRGLYQLRQLTETEAHDATRPDEFRQRYTTAITAAHPHFANSIEVLDIQRRPAVLQEWVSGVTSVDWPPTAATPGVWVRLLTEAAQALHHAHRHSLVHGRLTPEAFVLTAEGILKILGLGDPPWLAGGSQTHEPTPSADLRGLGQVAFQWSQLGSRRRGTRIKPFPAELTAVIRRLEIGSEPPMGDVVAIDRPFADFQELIRELQRLATLHPCPADAWEKLVRFVAENVPEANPTLRVSA